jgi:endonuclease-3
VLKREFDIDEVMTRIRTAVVTYPKAALFELYDSGFTSPFEILVACLISVRTRDEVSLAMARQLFARARTPAQIAALDINDIDALISKAGFHLIKSEQIHTMARLLLDEHAGSLPCSFDVMTSYPGIGPKCANLALSIACNEPHIGVDTHVHRITNRWGYVQARTPELTLAALEPKLAKRYWVEINALLVPFGRNICLPVGPKCATCPVQDLCAQVGVTAQAT